MQEMEFMDADSNSWASDCDVADGDSDYSEADGGGPVAGGGGGGGGRTHHHWGTVGDARLAASTKAKGAGAQRKAVNRGRWTKEEVSSI